MAPAGADRPDLITYDASIRLSKRLHGMQFKRRAPRAIREIRKFATNLMFTDEVHIDNEVNQLVWHRGIRNVPRTIRLRVTRLRKKTGELYTVVSLPPVPEAGEEEVRHTVRVDM